MPAAKTLAHPASSSAGLLKSFLTHLFSSSFYPYPPQIFSPSNQKNELFKTPDHTTVLWKNVQHFPIGFNMIVQPPYMWGGFVQGVCLKYVMLFYDHLDLSNWSGAFSCCNVNATRFSPSLTASQHHCADTSSLLVCPPLGSSHIISPLPEIVWGQVRPFPALFIQVLAPKSENSSLIIL